MHFKRFGFTVQIKYHIMRSIKIVLPERSKRSEGKFRFSIGLELVKCRSVTSISSYSFKARKLKIDRNNFHIIGTKSAYQFF